MFIRPRPPYHYEDAWGNQVATEVNNRNLVAGSGISIVKGLGGTHISLTNQLDPIKLNYAGIYNFSSSYNPNDVVMVDPTQTYWDQNGEVIPICSGSSASGLPPICGGLFVCTRFVPPYGYDQTYLTSSIQTAYTTAGQSIVGEFADTFRQYDFNVYYPIYPLIPTSSLTTATQSTWVVTANINFWAPLSPMFLSVTCNPDGTIAQAYINGVISGSVFNLAQLPYVEGS